MITASELRGVMVMMPAFATPNGAELRARSTIDVDNLQDAVNRMIGDGADVIATTGSFGEFHTLLWDEFETLARATADAVKKRVPLFIGCTALNSREVLKRMEVARDAGADGVLVGVPFYFPSSVDNAVQFYHDIAELFPDLGIMIYHNPPLHHIHIPVDAIRRILERPNVVAMKDSHRTPVEFIRLNRVARGRMTVFVNQVQYYPFASLGATACWSIEAWMGPWPVLRLRDAIREGNAELAEEITLELAANGISAPSDLTWRETAMKIAIGYAGYCRPGPLRPPFVNIPAAVDEAARRRAAYWNDLCAKYRPAVAQPA